MGAQEFTVDIFKAIERFCGQNEAILLRLFVFVWICFCVIVSVALFVCLFVYFFFFFYPQKCVVYSLMYSFRSAWFWADSKNVEGGRSLCSQSSVLSPSFARP